MSEKTFFEQGDVKVTNTRFISGNQTFAMSNITSIKLFEQESPPKSIGYIFSFLLLLFGVISILSQQATCVIVGVVAVTLAGVIFWQQKVACQEISYHVILTTSGGEVTALETSNKRYATKVVSVLNEAIVYRG